MPHRIFLVEDNVLIRPNMTEILEIAGAREPEWAEAPAIAAMCRPPWTVALVDLFLVQGSGIGWPRAFAGRSAHQKLYIVGNYATDCSGAAAPWVWMG